MATSKPKYLLHDCLDDRKELIILLGKLPPAERLRFLEWACRESTLPGCSTRPGVSRATRELADAARWDDQASARLTNEIYSDVMGHLSMNYNFDLDAALLKLEEFVRRYRPDPHRVSSM